MLDIKHIRENPELVLKKLQSKDANLSLKNLLLLDEKMRKTLSSVESLKSLRNTNSKVIGDKKRLGADTTDLMQEMQKIGEQIAALDKELTELKDLFQNELAMLPNLPMDGIKKSLDPQDNVCIKTVGEKRTFAFPHKNHLELNEKLDLFDFEKGAKIAGTGWPVYKNIGAQLEWALINYMLDTHIKNGFTQWMVPHLARPEIMYGSAQLPKFEDQLYKIHDKDYHLYLIPTSEAAINGLHFDEILKEKDLPLKYVSYTPCFRREAGASGTQERGLIRVHQFNKVEMFAFTKEDQSEQMFQTMLDSAEEILQGLGLHYRNMCLVTGDISFPAAKTIDIEAWLPGQDRYYEVSSVSNCTDYQARRSKIRYKQGENKPEFVHTLNGSGLATSRLMVALLENNQQEDGSVLLPEVLHKYLRGLTKITPAV
ncbi:MAG: serine--tRNA ligase [Simkaniaceae bacterium]|nr:serine--tRNA ligase [Simkaniaceae bacterium]